MSAADQKDAAIADPHATARGPKPIRIFTYPKIVFIFPTLVMAPICWIGMTGSATRRSGPAGGAPPWNSCRGRPQDVRVLPNAPDFKSPQNVLALSFLIVFAFNLLIMAIDFPRFTVVAGILLILRRSCSSCSGSELPSTRPGPPLVRASSGASTRSPTPGSTSWSRLILP